MTTFEPSPEQDLLPMELPLMQSAEDSPVRISARRGKARGSKARAAGYGANMPALLASFDRASFSWKTCECCLAGEWGEFSRTWPVSGMMRSGIAYQLARLVPPIGVTASGLLPSPTAKADMLAPSMQKWPAHRNL